MMMDQPFEPLLPRHLLENFPSPAEETDNEAIKCPICYEICQDAVIENACNHTFCKKCVEKLFKQSSDGCIKCPQTRNTVSKNQLGPNRAIRDIVMKIKVHCVLKDKGCPWKGPYHELENHLKNECPRVMVKCQSYGCEYVCKRSAFEKHVKSCEFSPKQCRYCNTYFIANKLSEHEGLCPSQVILCPYGCGKKMKKKDVPVHYDQECRNAVLACEFSEFGCQEKVKRYKYEEHIKENYMKHMENMKEMSMVYKKEWTEMAAEVSLLRDSTKIEEIKEVLRDKDAEIEELKRNLEKMKLAAQELTRRNQELERRIEILNNTEALYLEDNVSSDELEELDWEEAKKDEENHSYNSHSIYTKNSSFMNSKSIVDSKASGFEGHTISPRETKKEFKKEGWLEKKSKYLGEWRKRWMVLTATSWCAYKDGGKKEVTEKVLLRNIEQIYETPQDSGICFINIQLLDKKKFQFKAQSTEEAIMWIEEIVRWRQRKH